MATPTTRWQVDDSTFPEEGEGMETVHEVIQVMRPTFTLQVAHAILIPMPRDWPPNRSSQHWHHLSPAHRMLKQSHVP